MIASTSTIREFPGPAGRLEALFERPAGQPRAAVIVGHPHPLHGGTMHTKVVYRNAKSFLALGCGVLRFNFRGVGTSAGAWDEGRGERADFEAALDFAAATYPDTEIPLALLQAFYERVSQPKSLTVVSAANHLFDGRVADVGDAIRRTFGENES